VKDGKKVTIAPEPPETLLRHYVHLLPIVEALIAEGNASADGFHGTKDGYLCLMQKPIDFNFVRERFALPPSIELMNETNEIFCTKTWCRIRGATLPRPPFWHDPSTG
jgi:hypothetical protein